MTDLGSAALGVKVVNRDPDGRYAIEKQIIGDPHLSCLLIHTKLNVLEEWKGKLIFTCYVRSALANRRHA